MFCLDTLYNYNFFGNKFIKEIYYGNNNVLQFNKILVEDLNNKSLIDSSKYNFDTGYFDSATGGNGYVNFKLPISRLDIGVGYWNADTVGQVAHIDFIDALTGEQITTYTYGISNKSGVKRTHTFSITKNGFMDKITYWTTYLDAPAAFTVFEYDFINKRYVFRLLSGNSSSTDYNPNKEEYYIERPYHGCIVKVVSTWSTSTSKFTLNSAFAQV